MLNRSIQAIRAGVRRLRADDPCACVLQEYPSSWRAVFSFNGRAEMDDCETAEPPMDNGFASPL
jgi:hypothetical protein